MHVGKTCAILQVPSRLLPPNLHILVCRYGRQELQRCMSVSEEAEWWLEREMNGPKPTSRRALHAEKTYVRATQTIGRALTWNAVAFGCQTTAQAKAACVHRVLRTQDRDPAAAAGDIPHFRFKGTLYKGTASTCPPGMPSVDFCGKAVQQAVRRAVRQQQAGWPGAPVGTSADEVLAAVSVHAFADCQLDGYMACTPAKSESDRAEASSWVDAHTQQGPGRELLRVRSFVLVQRMGVNPPASPLRLAVVDRSAGWVRDDLAGSPCYIAPAAAAVQTTVLPLCRFRAPCALLRADPHARANVVSHDRLIPIDKWL